MMFCIETWNKSFCKEVSQFLNCKKVVPPKYPLLDNDDDDAQDDDDAHDDDGDARGDDGDHGEQYTMRVLLMMMIGEEYTGLLGEMSQSVQSPLPLC